ncbi:S-layer homology domain-containing protein [Paenibacillus sp. QZ-Y1]|uniref:S-layer homology domain-containing protein n=1 Tax=Paenibacillus sp. QZ-Y1 TaxID=3414511 RepID=UPI003F7A9D01
MIKLNKVSKNMGWMLAMTLCLTWVWPVVANAETSGIERIQANTYVGDPGEMVESFDITVANMEQYKELKASDFDITGNYDGYPLNEAKEIVQSNYAELSNGDSEAQGEENSEHMPQPSETVTRAQVALVLADMLNLPETTGTYPYTDSVPAWASKAITQVTEAGLMNGVGSQVFAPDSEVTRAQMAVIVDQVIEYQKFQPSPVQSSRFQDVDTGHWAYESIQNSVKHGVLNGVGNGQFAPKQTVTGSQLNLILQRLQQLQTNK